MSKRDKSKYSEYNRKSYQDLMQLAKEINAPATSLSIRILHQAYLDEPKALDEIFERYAEARESHHSKRTGFGLVIEGGYYSKEEREAYFSYLGGRIDWMKLAEVFGLDPDRQAQSIYRRLAAIGAAVSAKKSE